MEGEEALPIENNHIPMRTGYLQKSYSFLFFLLDSNSTKEQTRFLLQNLSKYQLQAIIEVLYNLFRNKNITLPPSLEKIIRQNQHLFDKVFTYKNYSIHRKFIQKHHRLIHLVLSKAKPLIIQVLEG